ncbi:MAG: flagellar biosynthesis regulator FlaF [Paracoccaceae bacterium]
MNAHLLARSAYSGLAPVRTDRDAEYEILARITRRLVSADRGGDHPALVRALHDNRALWTTFATDVAIETNGLPPDLRARLFYLAEFTLHHTHRVLSGDAKVAPLVDVNTAVMRGLQSGEATA